MSVCGKDPLNETAWELRRQTRRGMHSIVEDEKQLARFTEPRVAREGELA